jgi:NAD(P)H-dependent FMN reductase
VGQELTVKSNRSLAEALKTLATAGVDCKIVMVDSQLVPPAHEPASWNEVRLRTPAGMVTLRKKADTISVVVFGNAEASLAAVGAQIAAAFER